jgi:Uma2 family endonuclease
MGETSFNVNATILLLNAMQDFWQPRDADALVASNLFWYYRKGETNARVAPDVMVFPGVGAHGRRTYKAWEEKRYAPAVVFEIVSRKTWRNDVGIKFDLYEKNGVEEYYLFDPSDEFLLPDILRGYRLVDGKYQMLAKDAAGAVISRFGFTCRAEGDFLRFTDIATGEAILTRREQIERVRLEHARLQEKFEALARENARLRGAS